MSYYFQHRLVKPYLSALVFALYAIAASALNFAIAQINRPDTSEGVNAPTNVGATNRSSSAVKGPSLVAADRCTGDPKFLEMIGFSKRALVDTTSTHRIGLLVTDVSPQGKRGRSTQHESWRQAGFLGRVQRDREGNVYTYPAPSVTLVYNPVEKSNIVYRVDSVSGVMEPFVELPKVAQATEQNPFGLLALALDCEQNALYAASVYGSTASVENGIIARIDIATREVKVVKRSFDVLSLMVAYDSGEKRLFVGGARDNTVVSYSLNKDGSLGADERVEIKLDAIASAQDKRPRVLRLDGRGRLYVRAIPFDYNLAARTAIPMTEMNFAQTALPGAASRFTLVDQKATVLPAPSIPKTVSTGSGTMKPE